MTLFVRAASAVDSTVGEAAVGINSDSAERYNDNKLRLWHKVPNNPYRVVWW